jgi:hypothetical protein
VGDPGGVSGRAQKGEADVEEARRLAELAREFMDSHDPGALTDAICDEMRAEGLLDGAALADAYSDEMPAEGRR